MFQYQLCITQYMCMCKSVMSEDRSYTHAFKLSFIFLIVIINRAIELKKTCLSSVW